MSLNHSIVKLIPAIYSIFTFIIGLSFLFLSLSTLRLRHIYKSSLKVERMLFCQAIICFLVSSLIFVPYYSDYKVGVTLLVFLLLFLARFELWKILSKVLEEHKLLRIMYKIVVYLAIFIFGIHYILYLVEGSGSCCISDDVISKTTNELTKLILPFNMSKLLTASYQIVAFLSLLIYIRFAFLAYKKVDKFLFAGLMINIFYYSYFFLNFLVVHNYWIPIFYLADFVIYLRLMRFTRKKFA
ncbi:putative membrane protein [Bacteriovorax sp. BAL6_X]|nr:putative membrane protein [Bacteriovorax sp. BAL6_X]